MVVIVSSQKIVKNLAEAEDRQATYSLGMESARGRIAFAAMGFKESGRSNRLVITSGNPFAANRFHFIIVSDEALGF